MSFLLGTVGGSLIGAALFAAVIKLLAKLFKAGDDAQKWAWRGSFAFGFICLMAAYISYDGLPR